MPDFGHKTPQVLPVISTKFGKCPTLKKNLNASLYKPFD